MSHKVPHKGRGGELLRLGFADHHSGQYENVASRIALDRKGYLPEGTPIILGEDFYPAQPWHDFMVDYSYTLSQNSMRAYANDLVKFARFLEQRNEHFTEVTNSTFGAYRETRKADGVSNRTWARNIVVVRAFYKYLVEIGVLERLPWIQIGKFSVVKPRSTSYDLQVRALTKKEWQRLKNIGLGGLEEDGNFDKSFRGQFATRNMVAAELALTTGMRLQEWRSLLIFELIPEAQGGHIELEISAKGQRRRTVFYPEATALEIDFYLMVERKRAIRKAQTYLRRHSADLAWVTGIDPQARQIEYVFRSETRKAAWRQIPLDHRKVMVQMDGDSIEPVSLFIGGSGRQPSQRSWHQVFAQANERLHRLDILSEDRTITPHDLRHTFAVVLLQSLQKRALNHDLAIGSGSGTISEHIIFNPLLALQRLLGHASPETTMKYLRFVDESDVLVQKAFEEWDDPLKDFSDYVLAQIG